MKITHFLKSLGPGLLWAGAAIGVSHLVQSTRAGATYGFDLVWIILIINLFKYPFFEFGPRYAAATGETLIGGYRRLGKAVVWLYLGLTLLTMFTLQAAVTAVTAGLFASVFGAVLSVKQWMVAILIVATIVVVVGKYSMLDKLIKYIIVILAVSLVVAVMLALGTNYAPKPAFAKSFEWSHTDLVLLIAFAGWMPSAIDISVWHSAWTVAKNRTQTEPVSLKRSLLDFNIGYIGTVVLSVLFLTLGAYVMYGTGEVFSAGGGAFAGQLIGMFTGLLGAWSYPLIALAAIVTMVSTTLTCLDAFPRVLKPASEAIMPKLKSEKEFSIVSYVWLAILILGTVAVIVFFMDSMRAMVDLATTLSFLTAPILGYLNLRVVTAKNMPEEAKPKLWLRTLSWVGLGVLSVFSIYYIIWRFIL